MSPAATAGPDDAVARVIRAAVAGDAGALHELALWHVYGQPVPRDFGAARRLFGQAAEAGHRAATLTHAVFVALGAGGPANWQTSTALLRHAARTDPAAAHQQALIDAMTLGLHGTPAHRPTVEPLAGSPKLGLIRGLFTPAECAHVAAVARPGLRPAVVVDPVSGRQTIDPVRTSDSAVLGPVQMDLVVEALNRRIASVTATRVEQGEPLAVLRYAPGQEYRLHHDCLPREANQRTTTLIVFLNDAFEGGATHFPAIGAALRGRTGDAIVFANTLAGGRVDERSRHAGLPVVRGEKWICTRWIRARDFDPWGMRGR